MLMDNIFLVIFPYIALLAGIAGGIYRYINNKYSYSSLSSQFLENKTLFFGSVPLHYGISGVLILHFLAIFFPKSILLWNTSFIRLIILEVSGLALGFLALIGVLLLIFRRLFYIRARVVTTFMDYFLLISLLFQIITGVLTADLYGFGYQWFTYVATPYMLSIFQFNPDISLISNFPLIFKLHIFNAWILFSIFALSRLIHLISFPIGYLWRPYQVFIWNRR